MIKLKDNSLVRFVVALFLFGIGVGVVVYFSFKPNLSMYIDEFKEYIVSTHSNTILLNAIVISSIFLLSLFIIGIPIVIFYIFYEGLTVGYTLAVFILIYGVKGALFYLLFFIVIKLIFILLVLLFSVLSIKFSYKLIKGILEKNIQKIYSLIIEHVMRFGIILGICIVNSLIIFLISHKLVSLFINLIV